MSVAPFTTELILPGDLVGARRVQGTLEKLLGVSGFDEHDVFAIKLAVEESLITAIKDNRLDPDKRIRVVFTVAAERFSACVIAEGDGFDPNPPK